MERGNRKIRTGIVVSDKMDKTVVVTVETFKTHPLYKKQLKRSTKFKFHERYSKDCKSCTYYDNFI